MRIPRETYGRTTRISPRWAFGFPNQVSSQGPKSVLGHIGRATTKEQAGSGGKWRTYDGFHKSCELYNIDNVLLDPAALAMVSTTKTLVVMEGCFDVAKCVEAGVLNVVAAFGATVFEEQAIKIAKLKELVPDLGVIVWFDYDGAGERGKSHAIMELHRVDVPAEGFNWSAVRGQGEDACDLDTQEIWRLYEAGKLTISDARKGE